MPKFAELDRTVTLAQQLEDDGGPMILVNVITIAPDDVDQLRTAWAVDASVMRKQPRFISTQLHRGVAGSGTFLNHAVWESVEQYRDARIDKALRAKAAALHPDSLTATPHLFRPIHVPGICVA